MTALARPDGIAALAPGIRIADVKVGERARPDYGDLSSLKASIAAIGLLQPVVLKADDYLLCGGRRLEACRQLGWESIPFVRATIANDAISSLIAERDENICRKDMTPSELVALGRKIEELKRPEVESRHRELSALGGRGGRVGPEDPALVESHATRREVAGALGLSESQYKRAKRVVDAAENEAAPSEVRDVAVVARAEMDAGKLTITGADERIRAATQRVAAEPEKRLPLADRLRQIRELSDTGRTSAQIGAQIGVSDQQVRRLASENDITITADKVMGKRHKLRVDSNHIVTHAVTTLEAIVGGFDLINFADLDTTHTEYWAASLGDSISRLKRLRNQITEGATQ